MLRRRKAMKIGEPKICLVASAGGHLSQLLKMNDWSSYSNLACVTTSETQRKKLSQLGRTYVVGESNREHPLQVFRVLMRCIGIVLRERPRFVISTGASVGCLICYLSKCLGARVLWMDSITNVKKPSLSGRLVRHIADEFLVQWPELAERIPKAVYVGAVI